MMSNDSTSITAIEAGLEYDQVSHNYQDFVQSRRIILSVLRGFITWQW